MLRASYFDYTIATRILEAKEFLVEMSRTLPITQLGRRIGQRWVEAVQVVLLVAIVALDNDTVTQGRFLASATYEEFPLLVLHLMRDGTVFARSAKDVSHLGYVTRVQRWRETYFAL